MNIKEELIKYAKWYDRVVMPEDAQSDENDIICNVESYMQSELKFEKLTTMKAKDNRTETCMVIGYCNSYVISHVLEHMRAYCKANGYKIVPYQKDAKVSITVYARITGQRNDNTLLQISYVYDRHYMTSEYNYSKTFEIEIPL